ncbi:DUF2513 domain-containing protein [Crenobacter cavernae]|uniref:DUF2513 domain-containing protein n=1 Tax=Crenobacter cavernae TaxID=2290923 RepID=A0ABY0FB42_9NEIS|nr:DUF2513 domain-containing protein [Crenobacter cavernae]RXZ42670.1 DUF2513 domain-containing protein [Crenobacter cavernae]
MKMVRDFELIRKILLLVQKKPACSLPLKVKLDGDYDQNDVDEHVVLLIEAGLINGIFEQLHSCEYAVFAYRLTWEGHDFLGSMTDETIWSKAMDVVLRPAGSFTFDVLKEWLKAEAANRLGLS